MKLFSFLMAAVAIALLLSASFLSASENPKNRLDFWRANYAELSPDDDERAKTAHEIFTSVLRAAGKRPGILPRLYIIKSDKTNIPPAFAIPDGGIIISKRVLDLCYQDPEWGDDRLAFVLAHEIAHQLKEDFWHMKFFQAVELSKEGADTENRLLEEVRAIAGQTDKVLAKELQADEYGIVYTSMAGFDTDKIISEDNRVNFFEYFFKSMDPAQIRGFQKDPSHPTPAQRAQTVKTRLKQVLDKVELFDIGLLFYQTGDYEKAILFFEEFLRFFPGREVYHNLAAGHHQLALKYYGKWKEEGFPFRLSLAADSETRAKKIALIKRGSKDQMLFDEHIGKALEYYKTAVSLDPSYALSYNNSGCALIVMGEPYEAIANLKKAVKLKPDFKEALNNLGVAFFYGENPAKAGEYFNSAAELDPRYAAPIYNLGRAALEANSKEQMKKYWTAYLELDSESGWAVSVQKALSLKEDKKETDLKQTEEAVMGLSIGDYDDEIPPDWGEPLAVKTHSLKEEPFRVAEFKNGAITLSQEEEIQLIHVRKAGVKSSRGIGVGHSKEEVQKEYGRPERLMDMTFGQSFVYLSKGIAFQLKKERVVSWVLF